MGRTTARVRIVACLVAAAALPACAAAAPKAARADAGALGAGFRVLAASPNGIPGPRYWARVGREMASRFPGATPEAVWIVSRIDGDGTRLNFPVPPGDPLILGSERDGNEAALTLFDELGFRIWLQVEPVNAPVEKLFALVLDRYGRHPCVVGVGVDAEWYRSKDPDGGEAVSDAQATAWLAAARAHRPGCRMFLKHWLVEKMPPTVREGLLFVDDSQIFPSLDAMAEDFGRWARTFAPSPVAFQFGYPSDRPWWSKLADRRPHPPGGAQHGSAVLGGFQRG